MLIKTVLATCVTVALGFVVSPVADARVKGGRETDNRAYACGAIQDQYDSLVRARNAAKNDPKLQAQIQQDINDTVKMWSDPPYDCDDHFGSIAYGKRPDKNEQVHTDPSQQADPTKSTTKRPGDKQQVPRKAASTAAR
jgi:hypothetical protein